MRVYTPTMEKKQKEENTRKKRFDPGFKACVVN